MYAPEIAVPVPTSSHPPQIAVSLPTSTHLPTSLLSTTTPVPTTLSTPHASATHPSPESSSNNGTHILTNHDQGSLRTTTQATSCDHSCKIATATIIPICFFIMLAAGVWCVWGEKWRDEKRKRKMERDIEMRKIGGGEEMGKGKRDSGVESNLSDGVVVREVEDVWGGEHGGEPVEGKKTKVRTSWWAR